MLFSSSSTILCPKQGLELVVLQVLQNKKKQRLTDLLNAFLSLPCGGVFEVFQTDLPNNFSFHQLLVIVLAGLRHLFIK